MKSFLSSTKRERSEILNESIYNQKITYAENRFDPSDHKVVIFAIDVTTKSDDSQDEDDVEKDRPVSQHGYDQRKGEATEDTAEKDKREQFC